MKKSTSIFDNVGQLWMKEVVRRAEALGKSPEEVKDQIESEMAKEQNAHFRDLEWKVKSVTDILDKDATVLVFDSGENDFKEIQYEIASKLPTEEEHTSVASNVERVELSDFDDAKSLWQRLLICDPQKALWVTGLDKAKDSEIQEVVQHMMMRDSYAPWGLSFCKIDFSERKILLFHKPKRMLEFIPSYCRETPLKIAIIVL